MFGREIIKHNLNRFHATMIKEYFIIFMLLSLVYESSAQSNSHTQVYSIDSINYARKKDIPTINKAIDYYINGNYKAALETINKLPTNLYYNNPGSLYLAANCHFNLKDYQSAITCYSLTLANDPNAIRVYFFRGLSLLEEKKYSGAAADFAAFLLHNLEHKDAQFNLTLSLCKDGQVTRGIQKFESFTPKDSTYYLDLCDFYYDYANDPDKALAVLEKGLLEFPAFIEGLLSASILCSDLHQDEKALQYVNKAIALKPAYGKAYYVRGLIYEELFLPTDAETNFDRARELGYEWE